MKYIHIRFITILFILLLVNTISAKQYSPLQDTADYYVPGVGGFNFLDLEKNGEYNLYAIVYGDTTYIKVYNETGDMAWTTWLKGMSQTACSGMVSESINLVYVDDLGGNNDLDILASTKVRAEKVYLNPFSYVEREYDWAFLNHKLQVKWEKHDFEGTATSITTYDLDGDGTKEILASSTSGFIYVYDLFGNVRNKYTLDGTVYSMSVYDINHDGNAEIAAGTYDKVYLMENGTTKWAYPVDKPVTSIASGEMISVGQAENIIAASDGEKLIYLTSDGNLAWEADPGQVSGIVIADIDNDTSTEIIVASGDKLKAYTSNGSLKWEYQLDDNVKIIKLLSDNLLGVSTINTVHLLETDNDYVKNQTAYDLLVKAKAFYMDDNCTAAKPLIQEASDIFKEIENTQGSLECDIITSECDRDEATKDLADKYYATALSYYQEKDYESAKDYAEKARDVYLSIGYSYGVTWLTGTLLDNITTETFQLNVKKGDTYYSDAYWAYTNNDLKNATETLGKAKDVYLEINYTSGLDKAADLRNLISIKEKKQSADETIALAQAAYDQGNYSDAFPLTQQACNIYTELNLTEQITTSNALKNKTETYLKAQDLFTLAKQSYDAGNYENATNYAMEAKGIYDNLEDYRKSAEMDSFLGETQKRIDENRIMEYVKIGGALAVVLTITAIVFTVLKKKEKKQDA